MRYSRLTQKLIFLSLSFLVLPTLTNANSVIIELKERESQAAWRVETLEEDVNSGQQEFAEVVDKAASIQQNIETLTRELTQNQQRIDELARTLTEQEAALQITRQSLGVLVRNLEVSERTSVLALALSEDNFSDALRESDQNRALTMRIAAKYSELRSYSESLEAVRDQLEISKLALASARLSLDLQKEALKIEGERQKNQLVASRSLLTAAEAERSELRKQLFAAAFDNTGKGINLDEAINYASLASKRLKESTGQEIPTAFLLALVRHESNFGSYLGKGHYKNSMCSQAQIDAFLRITAALGLDPELTPVSRPAANQSCGGAMGYAQFLPRTWLGYADKVAQLTGHNPPSPWNPEDAFMAVALKLAANGGAGGTTAAEKKRAQWEAAMTYFSGGNWKKPGVLPKIRWYADRILETAEGYRLVVGG